jgi:histidinol dehydrogenase
MSYPESVAAHRGLFGEGVTPPQAVAAILASVREEGDAALRRWSQAAGPAEPADFLTPSKP